MRPTRISVLIGLGLAAIPAGWTLARLIDVLVGRLPAIPWATPALLVTLALALLISARMVRGWVRERRYDRQLNALRVARLLVLAKAGAVFGVVIAGGYAGFGIVALRFVESAFGRERLWAAGLTVVAGVLVTVAALRLENACRVPPEDEQEPGPPTEQM